MFAALPEKAHWLLLPVLTRHLIHRESLSPNPGGCQSVDRLFYEERCSKCAAPYCSMNENVNDPVYLFMDKKRSEGKHFYVYMVAGAAKL